MPSSELNLTLTGRVALALAIADRTPNLSDDDPLLRASTDERGQALVIRLMKVQRQFCTSGISFADVKLVFRC